MSMASEEQQKQDNIAEDHIESVPFAAEESEESTTLPPASERAAHEEAQKGENGTHGRASIMPLAVRTAFLTLAVLILLFACILNFSPYTAMKFYTKIDNRDMAFYFAEKYVARHQDDKENARPDPFGKYADALYNCNSNAVYFFNKEWNNKGYAHKDTKYYARKLDKYATMYLSHGSLADRTSLVDTYNLAHTAATLHPYVYSYADSLQIMRFKADYALGDEALPSWRKGSVDDPSVNTYTEYLYSYYSGVTTGWNEASGVWTDAQVAERADAAFLLFAQLSEYLKAELDKIGYYDIKKVNDKYAYPTADDVARAIENDGYTLYNKQPFSYFVTKDGVFTDLYKAVILRLPVFKEYIRQNAIEHVDAVTPDLATHLKFTYYLKSLRDFTQNLWNMSHVLSTCTRWLTNNDATREALQKTEDTHHELFRVGNVRHYNRDLHDYDWSTCYLNEWYEWGMMYDYLQLLTKKL